MHIRCPHCHNPIDIVDESGLSEPFCPSCGSSLNLLPSDETQSYSAIPRRIVHFELIDRIGVGHFGVVWKARDLELDRIVAVKIPRASQLHGNEAEAFLREARAAAQLKHPNIVSVHEVGRVDNSVYIVSDYVEGANLKEWLSGKRLSARESAELCAKIADALHHAHEAGVTHRDVKPSNIMIDRSGSPHVLDFGLAKRDAGEITMTMDGKVLGTPAYMSPEQAAGKSHSADRRTDVYSLGAVLFELLTGELPFRGETRMLLVQIMQDDPPSPRKLNGNIPRDLETICLKCLQKEPRQRYASAANLAADLRRWLTNDPILARRVSRLEKGWRWCRKRPFEVSTACAMLFVLAAAAAAVVYQNNETNRKIGLEKKANDRMRTESLVESAIVAPPQAVPYALTNLESFREYAVPILQRKLSDPSFEGGYRLHAALALAHFGQVRHEDIVNSIAAIPADECANVVTALASDPKPGLQLLTTRFEVAQVQQILTSKPNWDLNGRLAVVALHLGDPTLAESMCKSQSDPKRRVAFIETLSTWYGDLLKLERAVKNLDDASVTSAISLGVGSIPLDQMTLDQRRVWKSLLRDWYTTKLDNATHSSALWALRTFGSVLPEPLPPETHPGNRNWVVTKLGLTMLRIGPGELKNRQIYDANRRAFSTPPDEKIRSFWLGDREITVKLFQQFLDDKEYSGGKPENWPATWMVPFKLSDHHPMFKVSWFDAALFCNWLSAKEGLEPCYKKSEEKQKGLDHREYSVWQPLSGAGGYRLPTDAEWEFACRAGTKTEFFFGNDASVASQYMVFDSMNGPEIVARKMCNQWGFFDMHGNVMEWCQDSDGLTRVFRGVDWMNSKPVGRPSDRYTGDASFRYATGFRVARSTLDQTGKSSQ